jgi:type IV pilus assembly protein PilE
MIRLNAKTNATEAAPKEAGFTLIELVVAMLIAAVLVAIAIPSYRNYAVRSHRTDAKAALLDLASLEERYYTTANAYTNSAANLGYGANAWPITVGSGYYVINTPQITLGLAPTATTTGSPPTYSLTAVPIGSQLTQDTACASFTVTSAGARTATSSGGSDTTAVCWN